MMLTVIRNQVRISQTVNIFSYIFRSLFFADSHTKFGTNFVVRKLSKVEDFYRTIFYI